MKKLCSLVLALLLLLPATPVHAAGGGSGFGRFTRDKSYTGQFTDVSAGQWYYDVVTMSYELGLFTGQTDTTFVPGSGITVAETVTLACRLLSTYTGDKASFDGGSPWYQPYVDYAQRKGLISAGQFSDYNAAATRAEVAGILGALPDEMLSPINTVEDRAIPDVPLGSPHEAAIYRLYRAGVLTGSNGAFLPDDPIRRSEAAAIVARIAVPGMRQSFTLELQPVTLYADSGATVQVAPEEAADYLALGWRTAPFTVPSDGGAKAILNAATLSPMTTGDKDLDRLVDAILGEILTDGMTTYDKVKACYDYLIDNVVYGQTTLVLTSMGPYRSFNDYLCVLEAQSVLEAGVGVCDHYSAAFLVMTRRIGLECYVFSGQTSRSGGGYTGHAWNVITVGGVDYVFDAQVEDNIAKGGKVSYYRFCKSFDQVSENYIGYDAAESKAAFGGFVKG